MRGMLSQSVEESAVCPAPSLGDSLGTFTIGKSKAFAWVYILAVWYVSRLGTPGRASCSKETRMKQPRWSQL